jgi:hypothetical protein
LPHPFSNVTAFQPQEINSHLKVAFCRTLNFLFSTPFNVVALHQAPVTAKMPVFIAMNREAEG